MRRRLGLLTLLVATGVARAQDPEQGTYTARDPQVDALLEKAAEKERRGDYGEAVRQYLELEELLERLRVTGAWPVTDVGPGLDAGVSLYLRERIAALPPDGQREWRRSVDPRAREALAAAVAAGSPEAVEAVVARFPISGVVDDALTAIAQLGFERGEVGRVQRALERLEARAQETPVRRRAALLRLLAARAAGDGPGARAALEAFTRAEGDPEQARPVGGRSLTPRALAEEAAKATPRGGVRVVPPGFDPGGLVRSVPLSAPDAPDSLARRLARPPAHQEPVLDPDRPLVLVADGKTVRAVPTQTGPDAPRGWAFTLDDDSAEPSRVEVAVFRPALGPGRVFATLHRNRPAVVTPAEPGVEGEENKPTVERRKDWRVVALDRATGALVWDAADQDAFESISRNAEWVSAPLAFEGGVYLTVLERQTDLRATLVRLDAASGELRYRTFLASRPAYDHLGLGAPPPPPAVTARGDVLVATGLGALACVEPTRGEPVWIARYGAVPEASEPSLVLEGRRFRATAPLVGGDTIVLAPVDGVEVVALDAVSGEPRWTAPRGQARLCLERPGGEVLLLGRRLVALDRATGRTRLVGQDLGGEPVGPAALAGEELLVATDAELLRVGLADGAVRARLRFDDPRAQAGAAVLSGDGGALLTVSATHLNVWQPLAASVKEIERRHGGLRGDLQLGALRARRGELDQALAHLERAARKGGLEETLRLQARQLAFDLLAARAFAARDAGDLTTFVTHARRAAALTWGADPADPAEAREPLSKEEQALATGAADLLRAYADVQARADDAAAAAEAVRAYQALVRMPPATLCALEAGVRVSARAYGARRVRELVARRGRDVYARWDALAEEEYRLARASDQHDALARVCARYPASARDADARWHLALALEQRGLRDEAARQLERLLRDHPADARRGEALARLVRTYERLGLLAQARRALDALAAIEPEPRIQGDDGKQVAARAWAATARARLATGEPQALARARDSAGLTPPLGRAFRGVTELSQDGAALLEPGQSWAGPEDVFVLRRSGGPRGNAVVAATDVLEVRRVDGGELLAVVPGLSPAGGNRLDPVLTPDHLVVPFPDRLEGWALSGEKVGQRVWSKMIEPGAGVVVTGPLPVHEVRGAGDGVVVLTGRNDLLSVDAATGAVRWRRTLVRRALGGLQSREGLVLALSSTPAAIEAYRAEDGAPAWSFEPEEGAGSSRLSTPCWLSGSTFLFVQDGLRVVALDTTTGKRRYVVTADAAWFIGLQAAPDGGAFAARTQGGDGQGLRLYEAVAGQELWRDNGFGAVRPGQKPQNEGARPSLDAVHLGVDLVYTFRTVGGRVELWAQDLRLGKLAWSWQSPRGSTGTPVLVETPTAVVVPRHGGFGQRVNVSVIARGTGKVVETHGVAGRRLLGEGAQARAGVLVIATDRGVVGFATRDEERLAEATLDEALALEAAPGDARARARLAALLEQGGRGAEAQRLLRGGILAEGVRLAAFDRLFATLSALSESAAEAQQLAVDVQRMPRPPEVDGELSDWWRPWSSCTLDGPDHVQPIQAPPTVSPGRWSGDEDLSAQLYLGWDERHFYFALDVADTTLKPYDSEAEKWIGDCLLIAIDTQGNGGDVVLSDDVLLSLALTLPKKKDDEDEEQQQQDEEQKPDGTYFVRRKDDGSGAIYEAAIPWEIFARNGVPIDPQTGPAPGFSFGFNVVLTDDDGERGDEEGGVRGAVKTLQLTPSVLLHEEKSRLWQGYIPGRFARVTVR